MTGQSHCFSQQFILNGNINGQWQFPVGISNHHIGPINFLSQCYNMEAAQSLNGYNRIQQVPFQLGL